MSPLRLRLGTTGLVAASLAALRLAFPEPEPRANAQYLFVLSFGYGHLLGAALGRGRGVRVSLLARAFVAATLATGFVLYLEAVAAWPALVLAWLALSAWHIAENDAAMAEALRAGTGLAPLARRASAHAPSLAAAAGLAGVAASSSSDPARLADVFSAATLFHLFGWVLFLLARGASLGQLLRAHLLPFALCGLLLAWPSEAARPLREWVFSPAAYLYWASLHVVQTLWRREPAQSIGIHASSSSRLIR